MHNPRKPHLTAMKCILRYLQGTQITVSFCAARPAPTSLSTPTLTGLDVRTLVTLRPATRCSSGTTWCPGRPSDKRSSLGPARKPSTMPSPTAWLRPPSCASCSMSSRVRILGALSSTMTTSASCTSPPTPFSINTPNMWRLIFILSERVAIGQVCVLHVPTTSQFADIFTKGLPSSVFNEFRSSLNIYSG
jgi:hypothetical protein